MLESHYKRKLKVKLSKLFPGCVLIDNDPTRFQGIPDLLILYGGRWAMLEVKKDRTSSYRPNQPYWLSVFDSMSFASVIHPGNEPEVLHALQRSFQSNW